MPSFLMQQIKSFVPAFTGILNLLATQPNARIHAIATCLVIGVSWYLKLERIEWCWIIISLALVWIAEAFNTGLEFLADAISSQTHPLIQKAKDISAGAVFISAFGACMIGIIILSPYLFSFMKRSGL